VPEVTPVLESTIQALQNAGATIVDPADIEIPDSAYAAEGGALYCEFKSDIAAYLATTGPGFPKTLQDLIDFDQAHPELEGPWNDAVFEAAQATNGRDAECAATRAQATPVVQQIIDNVMADNDLDAIIGLTNGPAWKTDPVNGDLGGDFSTFVGSSSAAAIAGYAAITVPAGYVNGLPVGITFTGGRWDEPTLISLAYGFEQATHVHRAPQFLSTVGGAPTKHLAKGKANRHTKHGRLM
jgi:amidase